MEVYMNTLNDDEAESVGGGLIYLLATLGFVWYEAPHLREFADGFMEGWNRK
jgi:hypothetical protein